MTLYELYVTVDYTPGGYGNTVNGVTSANIGKVNGVATASIGKVKGVATANIAKVNSVD